MFARVAQRAAVVARNSLKISKMSQSKMSRMAPICHNISIRHMSTDLEGVGTLGEVLSVELQEEVQNDTINQEFLDIKSQISKTFNISEEDGSGIVKLTHKSSNEDIEIVFDCQDEVEGEPDFGDFEDMENVPEESEDDEQAEVGIKFHVTIGKKGTSDKIVFYCVAGQQIVIENTQFLPAGKAIEDTSLYHGPIFDKLSDDLRESMLSYLADRSIDEDMAFFIMAYSENKEQREYMNWLKNVMTFVEK